MRVSAILVLALVLVSAAGCGERPGERSQRPVREEVALEAEMFPLGSPTSVAGFAAGSLSVADLGDYRCDDTPGIEASCSVPDRA